MGQETLNLFPNEQALEAICQWSNSLKLLQQRLGKYYKRSEARVAAFDYIQALLSPVERKNGWQMWEQVGYENPYRFQNLLGRASWEEEKLCAEVRAYTIEHLDDGAGILAIDETCFLKKGQESAGVARQYCGLTGQIENCQVGVFMAYLSSKGQAFLRFQLERFPDVIEHPLFSQSRKTRSLDAFKRTRVRHLWAHRELSTGQNLEAGQN